MYLAGNVHFKVDDFAAREGDGHLALVDRAVGDDALWGRLPLVDTAVAADVADALGVNLQQGVVPDLFFVIPEVSKQASKYIHKQSEWSCKQPVVDGPARPTAW